MLACPCFPVRGQNVVIIVQLHIAQLHVRIDLVETVEYSFQRLKIVHSFRLR